MSRWKLFGGVAAGLAVTAAAAAGGAWWWVERSVEERFTRTWTAHAGTFEIPPPLTPAELDALRAERATLTEVAEGAATTDPATPPADPLAGVDLAAIATERAAARGKHLVESRYACIECHGVDFGGGTMIDDPMIGEVKGPNLTLGQGGVTAAYTAADWDRKVRHGVRPDGRSGLMPSEDYLDMSDRELGDIVTYLRSLPPVDRAVTPVTPGPLGKVLVATDQLPLAAARMPVYAEHDAEPPATADTVEFGTHLLGVCTGCHRAGLDGGPIPGAPPDWLPAANLTPHADGLASWTREDFVKVMRTGVRPDGTTVGVPMAMIVKYGARAEDVELNAMWTALQAAAPAPDGT